MTNDLPTVTIYTDVGCRPNPGPGGWGAVLLFPGKDPQELSGGKKEATNNRMELTAAIEALGALDGPHKVSLSTDSTYLKNGITQWLPGWIERGWKTTDKKRVKNRDLWEELAKAIEDHEIEWKWTKGHAGDRWNEVADQLASASIVRDPLPIDDKKAVHLFTAAAYSGKKKAGSWGVVMLFGDSEKGLSDRVADASPNRMHILGAVSGLEERGDSNCSRTFAVSSASLPTGRSSSGKCRSDRASVSTAAAGSFNSSSSIRPTSDAN